MRQQNLEGCPLLASKTIVAQEASLSGTNKMILVEYFLPTRKDPPHFAMGPMRELWLDKI